MTTFFVTGATGFVGSHVAERALRQGNRVLTLARAGSDTRFLKSLGAEIIEGDLTETSWKEKVREVDVVVHCAAKVGDWGDVAEYRKVNVGGLQCLFDLFRDHKLHRFVHVSSLGVYDARHHYGTDESEPLPAIHIDGYTQSKVEAEKAVWEEFRKSRMPLTVLRPGFIYGPRDRTVLPRLAERLRKNNIMYIARGKYALNTTYVENLVDAIFLAIEKSEAVGEVFNVTDGEFVSKRRFFESIADGLGLSRPKRSLPLWLAAPLARWRENVFRRKNKPHPPLLTNAVVKFAGLNLDFSIGKARTRLGYEPKVDFEEGMRRALTWYKSNGG